MSGPSNWFFDKIKNLRGYNLRYPMQPDIPRTMTYIDRKGRRKFGGYFIKIVLSFLEKHNAKLLECDKTKNFRTVDDLFGNLQKGNIDLVAYGIHRAASDVLPYTHAYPVTMDQMCIVTPYQHELPRYFYFLLPFDGSVWKLIGCSVCVFAVLQGFIGRLSSDSSYNFYSLAFQSFRTIVCQPHFGERLRQRKAYILSFIFMLFLASILNSIYTSLLTSFFTKSIMSSQISSYDDIVLSGIKIMLKDVLYDENEEHNYFPAQYIRSFVRGEVVDMEKYVLQMNTSFGYYLTEDFIDVVHWAQKAASYKYFYLTKLCSEQVFLIIPLEKDSPLRRSFDDLIFRCWSAGLIGKWKSDFVYESIEAGLLRIGFNRESALLKLTWEDLSYAWYIYLFGICISIVTFILEYLMILSRIKYLLKK
ncbi:unnamed protein product [Hermetia illucens]|uniref:Ionotropic receptor n=1 Tax=Hermetia illucens TaxID=343691 RepID=A0A7R8UI43_HERIL|nr:unnamed protein product [Hermetia illucens]